MKPSSLRARVMLGAVLWTIGLFWGAVLLSTAIMLRYPRYPTLLHGTAVQYALGVTALVLTCLIAGFAVVRTGLRPLDRLRAQLVAVHAGRARQVEGKYPTEIQPLVDDVNGLLAYREEALRRALGKAGDLAHGLKTPLAVLAHEAGRVRAAAGPELADRLSEQIERMRRQMDYHLAHARAAASGATMDARCAVRECVDGLARTMLRLYAERAIELDVRVSSDHLVRVQREDLDEMIGNLLDNACKWAGRRVTVWSAATDATVEISVEDDGPGLAAELMEAVLLRGVRADEAAPGSGFGLAIVREVAELHGGGIVLGRSELGGLRARLRLPAARHETRG